MGREERKKEGANGETYPKVSVSVKEGELLE